MSTKKPDWRKDAAFVAWYAASIEETIDATMHPAYQEPVEFAAWLAAGKAFEHPAGPKPTVQQVKLADVALLVRVVYRCRDGQRDVVIGPGMKAAAVRLCKAGLLQPPSGVNPARATHMQPTLEADRLVRERFTMLIQWEAETLD